MQLFARNYPEINNALNHDAWNATLPDFAKNPREYSPNKYNNFEQFMLKQRLITHFISVNNYAVTIKHVI